MAIDIAKKIERIRSGTLSRQPLETFRANAERLGAPDVVSACDEMLATLPRSRRGKAGTGPNHEIAERRSGFVITHAAFSGERTLLRPELIPVAEELARNPHVADVSILKTEIRLYFKGRHFTAGRRTAEGAYWVGCLDETRITDGTVECWKGIGKVSRAKYFSGHYVVVDMVDLEGLHRALQCVQFTQ